MQYLHNVSRRTHIYLYISMLQLPAQQVLKWAVQALLHCPVIYKLEKKICRYPFPTKEQFTVFF